MTNFNSLDLGVVIVAIVVAAAWIKWTRIQSLTGSTVDRLPLPLGADLIWGHEKTVFIKAPGQAFREWINDFGLTYRIKAALKAPDILILSDPASIAYVFQKRIYGYHHSKVVRPRVARFLGKGLGWIEGEAEHKRMKKLYSPSLTAENIKAMSNDLREAALRVLGDLVQSVQNDSGRCKVNILVWTNKATLNVIGRVAFMHDFECGNSPEAQAILGARRAAVSAISKYTGFLTLMLLRRFPILNDLPISAIQTQGAVKVTIQSGVAQEIVKRNMPSIIAMHKAEQKDLLSKLLIAVKEKRLPEPELYEHISTLMVAGQESTSQTIAFSVLELARHPNVQLRLRNELKTITGEPTYEDFRARLPYLDAVLRETLRIYPPLPYFERVATQPDVIPLRYPVQLPDGEEMHEVQVLPGQTVIIPTMAIQCLDFIWGDGEVFRPERWLEPLPAQEKLCSGWSNILAFSDGPRSCPGQRLAIFECKVILSALVSRFLIEDTGVVMKCKIASSLQPLVEGEEDHGSQIPVVLQLL